MYERCLRTDTHTLRVVVVVVVWVVVVGGLRKTMRVESEYLKENRAFGTNHRPVPSRHQRRNYLMLVLLLALDAQIERMREGENE